MNKIKKSLVLALTFLCLANIAIAQCPDGELPSAESFPATPPVPCTDEDAGIIFFEDFDGGNATNPPAFSFQCFQGSRDYLDVVCADGGGCANEVNADYVYNGAAGQFLSARDTDADGGVPFEVCDAFQGGESVTFNNIDISACSGVMNLCFSVAESANMNGDQGAEWGNSNMREDTWDGGTELGIYVNIDGAGSSQVTAIQAFNNSDTRPGIDLNCSGRADGAGEPPLTNTFTQYCFQLPGLGSTLDLEFEFIDFNSGGEDIAIDNIIIMCPEDPACVPFGVAFPPCTPFVAEGPGQLWIEDFDGSNDSNPPAFTYQEYCTNRDYFDIVCNDGFGCDQEINDDYSYFGASGQYFGVRDVDHNGCSGDLTGETVSFNGIDITGCAAPEVMYLCFTIAESRNQGGADGAEWGNSNMRDDTWDENSSLMISANVDAGGFLPVTAFEAQVGSDSTPGVDLNCDGDSGDAGEVNITDTFTQYCFNLPALGSTLDLNFEFIGLNTGGEDVAIDNISVQCGLPAGVISLPGKTPFTP